MTNYKFIGTGETDASGVARLTKDPNGQTINGYTGSGVGEVDFIASLDNPISSGSIVSETYEVLDCIFYDEAITGHKNTNWGSSGSPTITPSETGTTVSGTSTFYYTANQTISGDFEATLYCSDITGGVQIGVIATSTTTRFALYNNRYVKIHRENGVCKIYVSSDNENWAEVTYDTNTLTTEDCKFYFYQYINNGSIRSIKYKDLKIYSI